MFSFPSDLNIHTGKEGKLDSRVLMMSSAVNRPMFICTEQDIRTGREHGEQQDVLRTDFLTRRLHDSLEDDDDLKLFVGEGALRQVEKRAPGVDLVANGERRHQEQLIRARPKAHVQLALVQRQELAFGRLTRLERREETGG